MRTPLDRAALTSCGALLLGLVIAACGSPTSPSGASESFTWTVNGESFGATSNGRSATRTGNGLGLTGADCGRGAFIAVQIGGIDLSAPGTYAVGQGAGTAVISWTPDARTGEAASESWQAPGMPRVVGGTIVTGGSGSVTITSISNDWVSGTFIAEVVAAPGNRDTAPKTIQGTFELSFRERVIC